MYIVNIFFILSIMSEVIIASGFSQNIKVVSDMDFTKSYQETPHSKSGNEYLPLYQDTCSNIKYNGELEGQAIEIMNQTRDFIEHVTNQRENAKGFDRLNFLAAFAKCMKINLKQEFGSCKTKVGDSSKSHGTAVNKTSSADTGKTCLLDQYLEGIGEEDKILSMTSGEEKSDVSENVSGQKQNHIDLDNSKMTTSLNTLLEQKFSDGWFDQVQTCIGYEKLKIQVFMQEELIRNFNIVNSMVRSINNTCLPSLRKSSKSTNWIDIFAAGVSNVAKKNGTTIDLESLINDLNDGDSSSLLNEMKTQNLSFCIDGYGGTNCLSELTKLNIANKIARVPEDIIKKSIFTKYNKRWLEEIISSNIEKYSERYQINYKDGEQKISDIFKNDKIWKEVKNNFDSEKIKEYQQIKWNDMVIRKRYGIIYGSKIDFLMRGLFDKIFTENIWVEKTDFVINNIQIPRTDLSKLIFSTSGKEENLIYIEKESSIKQYIDSNDYTLISFAKALVINELSIKEYEEYSKSRIVPKNFTSSKLKNIITKIKKVDFDTKNMGFNFIKKPDFKNNFKLYGNELLFEYIRNEYNEELISKYFEVDNSKVKRIITITKDIDFKFKKVKEEVNLEWNLESKSRTGRLLELYIDSTYNSLDMNSVEPGIRYVSDRIEDINDQSQGLVISDTVRGLNILTIKLNGIEEKYKNK